MKVVGLVSGGKDSCFAMMKCVQYGHEVVALANLLPADDAVDELDSYMYQTVGHQIVVSYAKCMGVPLFRRRIQGSTRRHDLSYKTTPGDEVEDMYILLKEVKKQIPAVTAVSSGAIASDYQRLRVENVCSRLGLISLAYLWKLDQSLLLQEMIETGIFAITVKVAAIGLDPSKHLGKEMSYLWPHLLKLKELYGSNVCGEGGEYETLTLDCPLFEYARIVLDEFQLVLQSSNSIAPVGFLHPLAFHCEDKPKSVCVSDSNRSNGFSLENMESVIEVQNECLEIVEEKCRPSEVGFDLAELEKHRPHISKTRKENIFSMSCWLQGSSETSVDLQEDLKIILLKLESQLNEVGFSWENVLYVHLYISDMNMFAIANETYVNFITQDKCRFGVPSRSTIELPLSQVGLGRAYVEVLVTNDQSKKVLHVQSISSWAPSCIGPYSQATLHKEILYMAGQLGLDPSTMSLCSGGPAAELEQSLLNSEAVAKCFNCSISTSTILFVIYCSESTSTLDRISMQEKHNAVLSKMKLLNLDQRLSGVLDQFFLYVLVPDLPKRAFVEVKPILFVEHDRESVEIVNNQVMSDLKYNVNQFDSCFQPEIWHDECLQKCLVHGRICAVILSITTEIAKKICSDKFISANADDLLIITAEEKMERAAKFCVYRLDKVLLQNFFSWDDVTNLRIYLSTSSGISHETLSVIFKTTFDEFAKTTKTMTIRKEPIFNVVPVIGVGSSAASMDDIVTCELFATKS
ncbi:diphthine--ammonia ligase isoform X1 [Cynara cardunculus var. scolymus]|uniref:diphthine--ammonia ligase isoform X1 n=2 Tax=Cynara cardunculus var. scolymus TaxID=59895 RepID=UPI000D6262F7|nr:diphthine--ammonia ligase isoform X1 [Cynara cardunculus var. scolymus]XP_024968610.1 diphthine--ammonia ligase isoform X1 [Cynara cardunculus var. scolymus]